RRHALELVPALREHAVALVLEAARLHRRAREIQRARLVEEGVAPPGDEGALHVRRVLLVGAVIHAHGLRDVRRFGERVGNAALVDERDIVAARAKLEGGGDAEDSASDDERRHRHARLRRSSSSSAAASASRGPACAHPQPTLISRAGAPASGRPASKTPASGTPASGTPASRAWSASVENIAAKYSPLAPAWPE